MKFKVSRATNKDAKELHRLFKQAADYKLSRGDTSWRNGFSLAGTKSFIAAGNIYVARTVREIVGTIGLEWEDEEGWGDLDNGQAGYIRRMAVKDSFHGRQVGQYLLNWASSQIELKGRGCLRLDCSIQNIKLCAYYENQGFKRIKIKEFPEYGYTAALYERSVIA